MCAERRRSRKKRKRIKTKYLVRRGLALLFTALLVWGVIALAGSLRSRSQQTEAASAKHNLSLSRITDPYSAYDYDRVANETDELATCYPGLVEKRVIGKSAEGRELIAMKLGCGERRIILTGAIHGCESFTTNFLMNLIDGYAYGYAADETLGDYSYKGLLDKVSFIIVPMVNPDSVNIALHGPSAAANPEKIRAMDLTGTDYSFWKSNANGVDLNRNFPYNWSEYNNTKWPALRYYVGPYSASEPETRAIISLLESEPFDMLLDFHTYGEIIYWTDNISSKYYSAHRELAALLMDETGYKDAGVEDVDEFAGYLSNYARGIYGVFSATVELTPYEKYPVAEFDAATERVYPIGLAAADYLTRSAHDNKPNLA